MARLYLIRHGQAAAGYGSDRDPGLSDDGRSQAEAVVPTLTELLGGQVLPIRSSPLRRCQQTAAPLAAHWGVPVEVDPLIAEVAAPSDDLAERSIWLRKALAGTWSELEPQPVAWRARLLDHLRSATDDAVLFTHFVVVNAVIGAARGEDSVMVEPVTYTSVTVVDVTDGVLHLVRAGSIAETEVL